jgi:DNA-binding XRE family transcriptional regulator
MPDPHTMTLDEIRDCVPLAGCPEYRITKDGRIWTQKVIGGHGKKLGPWRPLRVFNSDGYLVSSISSGGRERVVRIHRALLESFVGPSGGLMACHNDGNPLNNDLSNLRWDTAKGNSDDRAKHGRTITRRGSKCPTAKLNADKILKIRQMVLDGETRSHIARIVGVSRQTVCDLLNGQSFVGEGIDPKSVPQLTRMVNVYVTADELEAIKRLAKKKGCSESRIVRLAMLCILAEESQP